jgi:hypothetical protein
MEPDATVGASWGGIIVIVVISIAGIDDGEPERTAVACFGS